MPGCGGRCWMRRGSEIERRDSKGALVLHAYDVLSRPIRLWARDGDRQPLTLRDAFVYGDARRLRT